MPTALWGTLVPRPLSIAASAAVAVLISALAAIVPAPIRAADPDPAPYLEAAEAAGLPCTGPMADGMGGMSWSCDEPPTSEEGVRNFFASVDDRAGEGFAVSVYRGWPDPRPAEPDVLALMDEYIVLTLGDDTEAREWLREVHDARATMESLQRGDWRLDWYADWETPDEGVYADVQLHIFYPALAPEPPPEATDGPTASAVPGVCLDQEVIDAIEQLLTGTVATDPPPAEVADALAGLALEGSQDEARDRLVRNLRVPPEFEGDLVLAANIFMSEVEFRCDPAVPTDSGVEAPETPAAPAPAPAEPDERPFAASVPKPVEVSTDPVILLQSAALAALLVFLMPFPSQLFNSTLETHEDAVRRWLRLDRIGSVVGGIGAFWGSWPGVAVFTLLAAVLYGFLDPSFGFSLGSLATFLGMLVGIVLVTAAFAIPAVLAHRRIGDRWSLKVVPVSLLIGVACVLLSRLTDFQPGYLYGLLIGLAFARELSAADEGRATALSAVAMLAVALVAWLGLGALPEGDGFGLTVARTSLAALMVAGLEGVVFGLLPMRFLPGEPLYAWNRILWGVLLAIGAFAFFHILINPASGYLSDTSRTPLFTVLALLIGFSLVSVAFWAWFRFRGDPHPPEVTPAER